MGYICNCSGNLWVIFAIVVSGNLQHYYKRNAEKT